MKITCPECDGTGRCPECDGQGTVDRGIANFMNSHAMQYYSESVRNELAALMSDEKRIQLQAEELIKLMPERRNQLTDQMLTCMKEIHAQADKLVKEQP